MGKRGRPYTNLIERIERHMPEMRDDVCWVPPNLAPHPKGYVRIRREAPDTRSASLHVIVWEAHHAEPKPDDMVIMHTCDNRACCNPLHLRLGTQQENILDCLAKGRHKPGPGRPFKP